jgi:hypothetical protein
VESTTFAEVIGFPPDLGGFSMNSMCSGTPIGRQDKKLTAGVGFAAD